MIEQNKNEHVYKDLNVYTRYVWSYEHEALVITKLCWTCNLKDATMSVLTLGTDIFSRVDFRVSILMDLINFIHLS